MADDPTCRDLDRPISQSGLIRNQAQSPPFALSNPDIRNRIYEYMGIRHYQVGHEWSGLLLSCRLAYSEIEEAKHHEFAVFMKNWDVWKKLVARSREFSGTIEYEVRFDKTDPGVELKEGTGGHVRTLVVRMNHPFQLVESLMTRLAYLPFPKMIICIKKDEPSPLSVWTRPDFQDTPHTTRRRLIVKALETRVKQLKGNEKYKEMMRLRKWRLYFVMDGLASSTYTEELTFYDMVAYG